MHQPATVTDADVQPPPAPNPAAVLDASSTVLAELYDRVPGLDALIAPDVTLSAVGLPFPQLNTVAATRFAPATADARIDEVIAWYDARGLPFAWHLGPLDTPNDLGARLVERGFTLDPDDMAGMAAPLADLPPPVLPAGASVELVRDVATFGQWIDVMVAGFEMPSEIGEAFLRFADLGFGDDLPYRVLLARIGRRPVAVSLAALTGRGVVIANVTTLADVRGRGLGRAITLAAMQEGADAGATIAVLQSTEMGNGVYRRLGFEQFARYRTYIRTVD